MPRNRHARKKTTTPVSAPIPGQTIESQNHANFRVNPFTGQDVRTHLIQLLVDSASLAAEPEFLDMEFDREKTFDVTNRHLKKSRKRLEAAQLKGTEAFEEASDDVHIEIANELITPSFRIELKKRLQVLRERMQMEKDMMKLQMVVALDAALELNTFPISMTGLINQIYNRTMQQSLQDYREEKELLDEMKIDFNLFQAAPQEIFDILETPGKLKPFETKLVKNPSLMQRLEKQVNKMMDDFETELEQGRVELDLFTPDELVLPFQRLQDTLGEAALASEASKEAAREQIFVTVTETLAETFTPERWQKFYRDVQNTARKWILTRRTWGAALQAELGLLDKDEYQQNRFVMFAFFGQIRRMGGPKNSKRSKK
jgi:hypothetical protein